MSTYFEVYGKREITSNSFICKSAFGNDSRKCFYHF